MMKFSNYFNDWLYGEQGYYTTYSSIGKEGDFFTSVSTSKFFGGSIGKKIVDTINEGKLPSNCTFLEIGAHHGYLFADIVQFIYTLKPELLETMQFAIVERFPHLREQQQNYLFESFGDAITIDFYNDISEVKRENAFVVANEIFDAFACELLYTTEEKVLQTAYVKDDKIHFSDCEDEKIKALATKYKIKKGELAVGYESFIQQLCSNIEHFEFITFDYGEKYPRNDFSTRIYAKHEVFPIFQENLNLKDYFAHSDITYDVNFSHVMDCFKKSGVTKIEYTTQLKALVEFGIIELLEILKDKAGNDAFLKEVQKVKTLLEPTGMGDRFKMLHIKK